MAFQELGGLWQLLVDFIAKSLFTKKPASDCPKTKRSDSDTNQCMSAPNQQTAIPPSFSGSGSQAHGIITRYGIFQSLLNDGFASGNKLACIETTSECSPSVPLLRTFTHLRQQLRFVNSSLELSKTRRHFLSCRSGSNQVLWRTPNCLLHSWKDLRRVSKKKESRTYLAIMHQRAIKR